MFDKEQVASVLAAMDIQIAGAIIEPSAAGDNFFVFVSVGRDTQNRQVPSNKRLHDAKRELANLGAAVEFLLTDAKAQDIEAGLRATLLHSFGEDIRNVFLSTDGHLAHAWVDPKRTLSATAIDAMKKKAAIFLTEFDLSLDSLTTTTGENLPSAFACLSVLRLKAPMAARELLEELVRRKFTVPSQAWLDHRLDALRRNGKIVRLESGQFVLTLRALHELGTAKHRNSPDLSRLLALAQTDR
ncbi:hypothetical protein [Burkholderia cepacia]|uniref:hypothetical protein n=1 Tax=Burkholderia cepacia TaxID=292 RepID=UPI00157A7F71|nr:hypothetical protein [Burkholderia cepacia]MCA8054407.1 hypothetical protein [Burkholderia cepacia]NTX43844.1 hypothetical protein [Burkholderia cepacia]